MKPTQIAFPTLFAVTMLIVAGCSSNLSKEECLLADWHTIGLEDGSRGYPLASIGRHREACAKAGVVPDREHYQAGLNEGYKSYCTSANGYNTGVAGRTHQNVCTGKAGAVFATAYKDGRELYQVRWQLNKITQSINNQHQEIADSQTTITDYEDQIVHAETTPDERRELLDGIKDLKEYINGLLIALDTLLIEQEKAQYAVADVQEHHRSLGY